MEIGNSGTKKDNANISGNVNIDNADASADMGSAATAGNTLNELIQTGVNCPVPEGPRLAKGLVAASLVGACVSFIWS